MSWRQVEFYIPLNFLPRSKELRNWLEQVLGKLRSKVKASVLVYSWKCKEQGENKCSSKLKLYDFMVVFLKLWCTLESPKELL